MPELTRGPRRAPGLLPIALLLSLLGLRPGALRAASAPSAAASGAGLSEPAGAPGDRLDTRFREKISAMLTRSEKSIAILREQISESQSAPFLADLYLQLAELLSQRANTLYYVEMEKSGPETDPKSLKKGSFSSVVSTQSEAITVYRKLLREFPAFPRRAQVEYRLALALKSVDEIPGFLAQSARVLRIYAGSDETMRTELLLGQYFFDRGELNVARKHFATVVAVTSGQATHPEAGNLADDSAANADGAAGNAAGIYEKNLARYRIGLIQLAQDDFRGALQAFESVITDPDLHEQDNSASVSLETKSLKSDLKREALTDSTRAFTYVFTRNPDPVGYYSRIAPSELHFQETIEKLAMRYIYLKNYEASVKLLRALSERTAEPAKVVGIYKQVLLMIPIDERARIPASEMAFLLEKYEAWVSFYEVSPQARDEARAFFEKQARDLATRNHQLAKLEHDPGRRKAELEQARDYYLLYLAHFPTEREAAHMAADLGDVYYALQDWLRSGDYYLRAYAGDYGASAAATPDRRLLIQNAILCLQKKGSDAFYDAVRRRGLLLRALSLYVRVADRSEERRLRFLMAETQYEQGFFPESLEQLDSFARQFPQTPEAAQAGELILDYFNSKHDYAGLAHWTDRMGRERFGAPAFQAKLAQIGGQARSKMLHEQIRAIGSFDEFSQGQSYLRAALASSDESVSNLALREALAQSRRERDIGTFLKTAALLGGREQDPAKRSEILRSIARQDEGVGRFYHALETLRKISGDPAYASPDRRQAFDEETEIAFELKDWSELQRQATDPLWASAPAATRSRVEKGWGEWLEAPISGPEGIIQALDRIDRTDEGLLSRFKASAKLGPAERERLTAEAHSRCGGRSDAASSLCSWLRFAQADPEAARLLADLGATAPTVEAVQGAAARSSALLARYDELGSADDPQLQMAAQVRSGELYEALGSYLARVAQANAELRPVLSAKAEETRRSASAARSRCDAIAASPGGLNAAAAFCDASEGPARLVPAPMLLSWPHAVAAEAPGSSSSEESARLASAQKAAFGTDSPDGLLHLARLYYTLGLYHQSAALALRGLSGASGGDADLKTVLGCSVLELGYLQEASYHLGGAKGAPDLKLKCNERIARN